MTRIYRPESGSNTRQRLLRNASSALERINEDDVAESEHWDIVAFVILCLAEVNKSIEQTVSAWENRGYWVKADQFRLEWEWAGKSKEQLEDYVQKNDLKGAHSVLSELGQPLKNFQPYKKANQTKPWRGSWQEFSKNL